MSSLLGVERIGLLAQVAGSRARVLEVAAKSGGQERAEDDIGTPWRESVSINPAYAAKGETYLKAGRESHRRKTNLKV